MHEMPHFNPAFAQVLRSLRERRLMTQMSLAVAIGGSEVAIRRMERGVQTPTTTTLILLARALSVTPEAFLAAIIGRMNALAFAADATPADEPEGPALPSS